MKKTLKKFGLCLALALLAVDLGGCGVTPKWEQPTVASFDGTEDNSGIVRFIGNGSLEITGGARARFNAYVERYGKRLMPPIQKDFGLVPLDNGNWSMTAEAADNWHTMTILEERERIDRSDSVIKKVTGQ